MVLSTRKWGPAYGAQANVSRGTNILIPSWSPYSSSDTAAVLSLEDGVERLSSILKLHHLVAELVQLHGSILIRLLMHVDLDLIGQSTYA